MVAAVVQAQGKLAAGARPALLRLPDIVVLAPAVGQPLVGGGGLLDDVDRCRAAAADLLRERVATRQNVQPVVAAQVELDRDRLAAVDLVEHEWVIHWREEAAEGIDDAVVVAERTGVAGIVDCVHREALAAHRASVDRAAAGHCANTRGQARAARLVGATVAGVHRLAEGVGCTAGWCGDGDRRRGRVHRVDGDVNGGNVGEGLPIVYLEGEAVRAEEVGQGPIGQVAE